MGSVKIYGFGWVGKAMQTLFPDALIHDPALGRKNNTKADVALVCVPTPNIKQSKLDTSIVEQVVKDAKEKFIIIRSTINPGTCDKLEKKYGKDICFMPEYLGETPHHPLLNVSNTPFLVIGGRPKNRRRAIELFQKAHNANITLRQVSLLEAEIIKLSENRAIAFKVAQCQELFDACEKAGVDFYTIRDAVYGDDPRFNLWFSFVYPEARGMNSKCIPKDVYAWAAWAESLGYEPKITNVILNKNKEWVKANA